MALMSRWLHYAGAVVTAAVALARRRSPPPNRTRNRRPRPAGRSRAGLVGGRHDQRPRSRRHGPVRPVRPSKHHQGVTGNGGARPAQPGDCGAGNAVEYRRRCSCVGLVPGAIYTTRQLLDALLMVSGNDAANLLGEMLGGPAVAVQKMNLKAAQVGARSTRAGSPSGLDGPGWESVTTPMTWR